jgi:hypothetical protein
VTNPTFLVHVADGVKFFDKIGEAQDHAERYTAATISKEYEGKWTEVAAWNGLKWTYKHRKTARKAVKKGARR